MQDEFWSGRSSTLHSIRLIYVVAKMPQHLQSCFTCPVCAMSPPTLSSDGIVDELRRFHALKLGDQPTARPPRCSKPRTSPHLPTEILTNIFTYFWSDVTVRCNRDHALAPGPGLRDQRPSTKESFARFVFSDKHEHWPKLGKASCDLDNWPFGCKGRQYRNGPQALVFIRKGWTSYIQDLICQAACFEFESVEAFNVFIKRLLSGSGMHISCIWPQIFRDGQEKIEELCDKEMLQRIRNVKLTVGAGHWGLFAMQWFNANRLSVVKAFHGLATSLPNLKYLTLYLEERLVLSEDGFPRVWLPHLLWSVQGLYYLGIVLRNIGMKGAVETLMVVRAL